MTVELIKCRFEATRRCERMTSCVSCGLKLCERHDDHCKVQGHYKYDGRAWCETCWKKHHDKLSSTR